MNVHGPKPHNRPSIRRGDQDGDGVQPAAAATGAANRQAATLTNCLRFSIVDRLK